MTIPASQNTDPLFLLNGQISDKLLQSNERKIFIAIMGMTGAGKSTFISHCTEAKVAISDPGALQSCTQEVQVYRCKDFTSHANVYLVDTPGFDDTNRKDTDILKEIATWLTTTYKKEIRLSGILYLHRISDNRMGGCAHRNLIMFKKLCGPEGIKSVVFLTTFWEKVDATDGDNREKTLKTNDKFWGYFVERGARVQRHWNTEDSAMAAIHNFVPSDITKPFEEIKLAIQTEMVDSHKDLDQTSAGQELQNELQKERDKMQNEFNERTREIQEEKDQEMRDLLQKDQERQARDLRHRDSEIQELKISMERMHEKKIQELEKRVLEQHNEARRHREETEQFIRQLQSQIEQQQVQYNQIDQKANDEEDYEEENSAFKNSSGIWVKAITTIQNGEHHDVNPHLTCLTCKEEFAERRDLFKHLFELRHARDLITGKPGKYVRPFKFQGDEVEPYLTCLACKKGFSRRQDLFKHLRELQHARDLVTTWKPQFIQGYEMEFPHWETR